MDNEQPHQELVKCVVVGDTAVGKTRLICARACNAHLTLSQLMTTHIPTVWAIDQYRIYKEVLERSWEVVDGVNVSLRLWDTFGDHEKDRRFAYGRSDVVLLCFSVANPVSLRNCKVVWYPEIRRFCPNTPIILVGCKNDLRFMYRDEQFLALCRDRSPFFRPLKESDILTPEQGRAIAKEIGAPYYETSVLTHYGVHEVFDNVIRAALLARRQQRFWMTNLKHVQRPLLQEPFCPPKPPSCELTIPPSQFEEDMLRLCRSQAYTDVIFVAGSVGFSAHRFVLAAVSPTFHSLLTTDLSANIGSTSSAGRARSASDSSVASSLEASVGNFNLDTEQLLGSGKGSEKSCSATATMCASFHLPRGPSSASNNNNDQEMDTALPPPGHLHESSAELIRQPLNHVAFSSIAIEQCDGLDHRGKVTSSLQTVVTMSPLVSPTAFQHALRFLYTGSLDLQMCINLPELLATAEYLEISDLRSLVTNIQHREEFLNSDLRNSYLKKVQQCLKEFCLDQGMFSDVLFQLDDGQCAAHRPILMARCEVMAAMFKGNFRESNAKVIQFPGVTRECFQQMLVYIYTDELDPGVGPNNCLPLIALANRLCLPHLVALVEQRVVASLVSTDSTEQALRLLEPCQLHNADQLADWFLYHIAINYNEICRKSPKLLRNLHPENQAYLNRNRWPPIWYLKEFDFYERCMRERLWQEKPPKLFKRQHNNGCLCFSGGKKRAYRTV